MSYVKQLMALINGGRPEEVAAEALTEAALRRVEHDIATCPTQPTYMIVVTRVGSEVFVGIGAAQGSQPSEGEYKYLLRAVANHPLEDGPHDV